MLSTLLVFACATAELPSAPADMPASSFDTIGSQATVHLATLPATLNLPAGTVDELPAGEIVLEGFRTGAKAWKLKSPVTVDKPNRKYTKAPQGMSLTRDGEKLRYRAKAGEREGWTWHKGSILVTMDGDPADHTLVLEAPHVGQQMRRLEPSLSGLQDADYVQFEMTKGTKTRSGLLLPAPASHTTTFLVPDDAHLETWVGLAETGLLSARGNGASLVVEVDGEEVDRRFVDDTTWREWTVDLSAYAGQTVQLTLRADGEGDNAWDHLFVASPRVVGKAQEAVRTVVVIGIDTLRYDQVTQHGYHRDVTAELDPWANSSVIFDNAWAPAPRTRPSFRSSTTGAYPFKAIDAPTFGEVFQGAGFVTGGVTANVHLVPDQGFTDGFDFWQFENSRDADVQLRRAKDFLTDNQDRDTFLFLHVMDPHNFYRAPGLWANKYVEHEQGNANHMLNRWQILSNPMEKHEQEWLRDRYDGEIAYMAHELAKFISWLTRRDGEVVIAMHSDHGEEFWEHGSYEHNHTLYNEVVKANLWIRPPGGWAGGQRVEQPVSLIDMAPTLYDFAGIKAPEDLDGVSLRPLMDSTRSADADALRAMLDDRPVQIGHLMYDRELWGVVDEGWKYIVRTCDGHQELYNLGEDPGETINRLGDVEPAFMDARLDALAEATGFAAGPGFRVEIVAGPTAFGLDFDGQAQAIVMDPEACKSRRANVEWGDMPEHWAQDVGAVTVNEQGVAFVPGSHGRGKLMVLADAPPTALRVGDEVLENPPVNKLIVLGGLSIKISRGPVLIQTDSVATRLGLPQDDAVYDDAQIQMLQMLGYMGDDEHDH